MLDTTRRYAAASSLRLHFLPVRLHRLSQRTGDRRRTAVPDSHVGHRAPGEDLTGYHGMILCNARGWAPVSRVDDLTITQDEAFAGVITAAIDNCPWGEI